MSVAKRRFSVALRPDGRPQVTDLATGEVLEWVDAVQVMSWQGEGQILWLGAVISDLTVATAPPATPLTPSITVGS